MSGRRIESFLLRLVVNETQGMELEIGDWRGRIQHIGSGHERYFEHLEDIVAFINEQFSGGYRVLQNEKETQNTL
jgi:hypothetical protein